MACRRVGRTARSKATPHLWMQRGVGGALNFSPAAPDTGSRMGEPVVLVVGAGLSGLTCASELLRRPGSPRVVVLEASNRTHPPLPPRLLPQQPGEMD